MKPDKKDENKVGIYCIRNIINNKVYIGKSKNIYKRLNQHINLLKYKSLDENRHLINAWHKYGRKKFECFVLEYVILDDLLLEERELYYQKLYKCTLRKYGYNLRLDSSTKCITHEETSKLISNNLRKQWKEGIRDSHSLKLSKNWESTPERREVQSKIMSKNLTKYSYNLYDLNENFIENCFYNKLIILGLKNCITTFFKKNKNKIKFKSYIIEKITIKDMV